MDVPIPGGGYLNNNNFSLFANPSNVWFETDPIKQVVRVHGKGLSANYHSDDFRYKLGPVVATGAVTAKLNKIDIELDITMVTQECEGLKIPAFNSSDTTLNVNTDYIDLYFPRGNFWTHFGRQF